LFALRSAPQLVEIAGLQVLLTRKAVKNINLRVRASDAMVTISAPPRASLSLIESFVASRRAWIEAHQTRLLQRQKTAPQAVVTRDGDSLLLWGEKAVLRINSDEAAQAGYLDIQVRSNSADAVGVGLDKVLRDLLNREIQQMASVWEAKIALAGPYRIRKMKSRWGSCNTRSGAITLNLALVHYPKSCLEYVLVHELTHLLEPSHNRRFHSLVEGFMPDWKTRKKQLNGYSPTSRID
jgi:predicted metal-dependent hydrolase